MSLDRLRIALAEFQPRGGLTHHTGQLADALARRGHDVTVVAPRNSELRGHLTDARLAPCLAAFDPGRRLARGRWSAPVQRLGRGAILSRAWWDLERFVHREVPDVLQLSELRTALDGAGASWLARRCRRTLLVDMCHNVMPFDRRPGSATLLRSGPVLRSALAMAYRRMDAVVVHGKDSQRRFSEHWPGVGPVEVVPHGDARIFGGALPPWGGPPTVLFFGSWAGYKGLDVLFDAFALVRQEIPNARLELAGAPTREVPEEWVMARCRAFGGSAHAAAGYVPIEAVRQLFARASVVALPHREGFQSAVAFLAFTLGRPVVCTRVGDVAEAVDASGGGLAVPPGNPDAFAAALVALLRDRTRAQTMGHNGRSWVVNDSSWDVAAERLEALYHRLSDPARGGSLRV